MSQRDQVPFSVILKTAKANHEAQWGPCLTEGGPGSPVNWCDAILDCSIGIDLHRVCFHVENDLPVPQELIRQLAGKICDKPLFVTWCHMSWVVASIGVAVDDRPPYRSLTEDEIAEQVILVPAVSIDFDR